MSQPKVDPPKVLACLLGGSTLGCDFVVAVVAVVGVVVVVLFRITLLVLLLLLLVLVL